MRFKYTFSLFVGVTLLFFLVPHIVSAHEVYVLNANEIQFALKAPSPDFLTTITTHLGQFLTWGLLTLLIVIGVFFISIIRPVERAIDPFLNKLKVTAPLIAQVTLGAALLASGYYHAIFGIELPVVVTFGIYAPLVNSVLMIIGVMLLFGILPRVAAIVAAVLYLSLVFSYGVYMLNYATYAGEALTVALFGGAYHVIEFKKMARLFERVENKIVPHLHAYKFLIMRVLFGVSLVYASLYAKFFHGELALETVTKYHLTQYFHFDPVFLVLGAMAIEVLLGFCFILGFEIRFASLFFLIFLTLSLLFFGEAVWPHVILIGTALAMFAHGYDAYCLSALLSKQKNLEPVL